MILFSTAAIGIVHVAVSPLMVFVVGESTAAGVGACSHACPH